MKVDTNLKDMLGAVSVPADWVGIREVMRLNRQE